MSSRSLLSIRLTSYFMMVVGFWLPRTRRQEVLLSCALYYTIFAILFAIAVELMDFSFSLGDFSETLFIICNLMVLIIVLYKILVFSLHREKFIQIIGYSQKHIWSEQHDEFAMDILNKCERKCLFFVSAFTFFAQGTVCCYTARPIIANIGSNASDRVLPFTIWLDLPMSTTPYYEITFVVEVLSMYHCGVCFFCFDNLMCIFNIYAAGQFKILRHHLELLFHAETEKSLIQEKFCLVSLDSHSKAKYAKFKGIIRRHQSLICYTQNVESVFSFSILGQVLFSSLMICLLGYEILLDDGPMYRRLIFIIHSGGTFSQLLMFTLSCDGLIQESRRIADSMFQSGWEHVPFNKAEHELRKDVIMVIMRAQQPCCLSAGGFFPVSLATFMSVISTAISYFTLLRQQTQ